MADNTDFATGPWRLDERWLGESREYAIRGTVVYIRVGDEKKWRIDRAETERRRAMAQRATSRPSGGTPVVPDVHMNESDLRPGEDQFYRPTCSCGWTWGPVPDLDILIDALMAHAYEVGRKEKR